MMPSEASPMPFSAVSAVTSPVPSTLTVFGSSPRSASALANAAGCAPAGTNRKIDSGFRSFARCTKAEKSGLAGETHRPDNLAAGFLEGALESLFGIVARAEIGHHRIDLLDAILCRPHPERFRSLRQRDRGAHRIGRLGRDDRGPGIHDHHQFLRRGRDIGGERIRRQYET